MHYFFTILVVFYVIKQQVILVFFVLTEGRVDYKKFLSMGINAKHLIIDSH